MSWKNPPSNFAIQVLKGGDEHLRKVATEVLQGVIMRSPVDQGAFRSNHLVTVNSKTDATVPSTGNTSPVGSVDQKTLDTGKGEILKAKIGDSVCIQNNLSYGIRLENGYSDQAELGIYARTFQYISSKYK